MNRESVEVLLSIAESGAAYVPAPEMLAELCRTWLALDASSEFDMHIHCDDAGRCIAANFGTTSDPGQRVRLVATPGTGRGGCVTR